MIELAEANGHLAASRAWSCDHHQWASGFHIVVAAKAFFRVDESDIVGIAFNDAVVIHLDAHALQTLAIGIGAGLTVVMGHHHRTHHETTIHEFLTQTQHIHIVSDAQVAAHLVLLNVDGTDDNDDFSYIDEL